MSEFLYRTVAIVAVLATAAEISAQNLLVNGDFEVAVPTVGTGGGWTAGNNDGLGGWRSSGGNPAGSYILNWNGSSIDPFIYQDVSGLTPGATYNVRVDFRREYFSSASGALDFGIEIDGRLWEFDILNDDVWRTPQVNFVATQANVRLQFTGERHQDASPRIDNAVLSPVPEPATLLGLAIGLRALGRKRR